jgi:hypothetical protein
VLAVCLLAVVGIAEWTRTYITAVTVTKKQFDANKRDLLSKSAAMEALDDQIRALPARFGGSDTQGAALALEILNRQRNDLRDQTERISSDNEQLWGSLEAGYRSLNRVILFAGREELPDMIATVSHTMGSYLLPVLYGALGTCAFILRSLYAQMLERSFDPRRSGEFMVRLFLGMLSGVTVQWVFVKDGNGLPAGTAPLVLAFLAGYSVELLFSSMDRMLAAVSGRLRPPHTPRPSRVGASNGAANGANGTNGTNGTTPAGAKVQVN